MSCGAFFDLFSGPLKSLNILNFKREARRCTAHQCHKAANRIKQEAGFPSCFPDETLILAVFIYEELYHSKSKHYSNWLLLSRKCNWKRLSSRDNSRNRWWYSLYSYLFYFLYREPKTFAFSSFSCTTQQKRVCLNPFCKLSFIARLRTQARSTGAPHCFAQRFFAEAF